MRKGWRTKGRKTRKLDRVLGEESQQKVWKKMTAGDIEKFRQNIDKQVDDLVLGKVRSPVGQVKGVPFSSSPHFNQGVNEGYEIFQVMKEGILEKNKKRKYLSDHGLVCNILSLVTNGPPFEQEHLIFNVREVAISLQFDFSFSMEANKEMLYMIWGMMSKSFAMLKEEQSESFSYRISRFAGSALRPVVDFDDVYTVEQAEDIVKKSDSQVFGWHEYLLSFTGSTCGFPFIVGTTEFKKWLCHFSNRW